MAPTKKLLLTDHAEKQSNYFAAFHPILCGLSTHTHLQDILLWLQSEGSPLDGDAHIWHGGQLLTLHHGRPAV
jgi:hypothetical protein